MYFWRITALKHYLTERGLTDQQTFPYLLCHASVAAVLLALFWLLPSAPSVWRYLQAITGVVITVLGLHWVYRRNGGDKGSEFLSRFLSLAWVSLLRFGAALVVVILLLQIARLIWPASGWYAPLATFCFVIWYGALYGYLGKQIHAVAAIRGELP